MCVSKGLWPNFDQKNISHRWPCSVWIVNLLTWQNAPEGGYDEKSWEMAYNWLMMTSSGDDNWPSGSLGLLTDKTATTFCEKTLPRNNLKDGQDLFPYLKPLLHTLWCVHKVKTDYRPKHWKYWLGLGLMVSFFIAFGFPIWYLNHLSIVILRWSGG